MQALSDHLLRPPGCESHPIVLDPHSLLASMAAAAPLHTQTRSKVAKRDMAGMEAALVARRAGTLEGMIQELQAESVAQARMLEGMQRQLAQLTTTLPAMQAATSVLSGRDGEMQVRPGVEETLAAYLGLFGSITLKFEFEVPGSTWLGGEVGGSKLLQHHAPAWLHTRGVSRGQSEPLSHGVPVYGGAYEVQLRCWGRVAAYFEYGDVQGAQWEPFFYADLVVARVKDGGAARLAALLPRAKVRLVRLTVAAGYEDAATGRAVRRGKWEWDCEPSEGRDFTAAGAGCGRRVVMIDYPFHFRAALQKLGAPPPYCMASRDEAVKALEAALGAHNLKVTGELELSA